MSSEATKIIHRVNEAFMAVGAPEVPGAFAAQKASLAVQPLAVHGGLSADEYLAMVDAMALTAWEEVVRQGSVQFPMLGGLVAQSVMAGIFSVNP